MEHHNPQYATEYVIDQDTFTWPNGDEDYSDEIEVIDFLGYVVVDGNVWSKRQVKDIVDVLSEILEEHYPDERWKEGR